MSITHRTALTGCLVGLVVVAVAPFVLDTYLAVSSTKCNSGITEGSGWLG